MKKILVFYSYKKHKTGYYKTLFSRLNEGAKKHNLKLFQGSVKDLRISIQNNKLCVVEALTNQPLNNFDVVYFELWSKAPQHALAAAIFLHNTNTPFITSEMTQVMSTSKLGEMAKMTSVNLPMPDSYFANNKDLLEFSKQKDAFISFPMIVKNTETFGGQDNYLVKNSVELEKILAQHPKVQFVLQQFIPNDCDYRVLVFGGKIRAIMRRTAVKGSHLNNTSAGGEGEMLPLNSLSPEICTDVLMAAKVTNREELAGVDVVIDKNTNKHYILEVNQAPGIELGEHTEVKMDAFFSYVKELAN